MDGNLFILSTIVVVLIMIMGFSSVNYKLKKKLENDDRIIERLDRLIDKNSDQGSES